MRRFMISRTMRCFETATIFLTVIFDVVLTECSEGCQSCSASICLSCEPSYFMSNGFCSKCPEDCNSCNSYDDCTSCKPNKHGLYARCAFDCTGNCLNGECQDDTGYCMQCKSGRYGFQCQHNCTFCKDESCNLRACSYGCKNGYYEYEHGKETICQSCPSNCRHCKDQKSCYECNDDNHLYKLNDNDHCISCSLGPQCLDYCIIQGCNECQIRNKSLTCIDCPEGHTFNGITCETNASPCSKECSTYCDSNGICQGECNDGWTGEKCANKCSDRCLKCSKENGNFCHQCKGDFYSTDCSLDCNLLCMINEDISKCRISDGYCLNGCKEKFWGETCNKTCSEGCTDAGCNRVTGKCTEGCKDGYSGVRCIQSTTKDQTEISSTATTSVTTRSQLSTCLQCESNHNFIIGYFSGIGTSIVIVIITVLVYFVRRRYIANNDSLKSTRDIQIPTYYNTNDRKTVKMEPASVDNNYESLSSNRVTDKDYCDLGNTTN